MYRVFTAFILTCAGAAFGQAQSDPQAAPQPAPQAAPQPTAGGWRQFGSSPSDGVAGSAAPQSQAPQYQTGNVPSQITVPAGTFISARVDRLLSSDHNQPGDAFTATLIAPLVANGLVIARPGQLIAGRVAEAQKAGKVSGTSRLGLELTEMTLVDGQQIPVRSQLIEYTGGTSKGRDAAAIGTTTGLGAAVGAAADGGRGAGIGAAIGAAASTIGVLVTRGRPTEVYPETPLTFRTTEPVTISTEHSGEAFLTVQQRDFESAQQPPRPVLARPPVYYGGYYDPYPYFYGPGFYGPSVFIYSGPRFRGGGFRRR